MLRKRQFLVRFVSCHARILPIKIFFSFEAMSRYTSIRNKKHFDFCSLIRILAIRLKNVPSNGGDGHPQAKRIFSNLKLFRLKDASIIIPQQYICYSQKQTEQLWHNNDLLFNYDIIMTCYCHNNESMTDTFSASLKANTLSYHQKYLKY